MPTNLSKQQALIIIGIIVLVLVVGTAIFLNLRPRANTGPTITLKVWGTEPTAAFSTAASSYPYATVTYTHIDPANYDAQVLAALAAGNGPDVFEIGNHAVPRWSSVIAPLSVPTSSGATFGPAQIAQLYPDVVGEDWVLGGQVYGLPVSLDTLVMAYNKDLFNQANIALPPATWDDFDTDVAKLRTVNAASQLTQAAAAIGASGDTVPNATDILSLLMLQNGTTMVSADNSSAVFASQAGNAPGLAAFNFYLQFANAASPYYAWNPAMGAGLDSFAAGKTAIVFVYQSDLAALKAKAPFLNYALAPVPQAKGATAAVNYARYNGFVAARAGQQTAAWDFIIYESAQGGIKPYLASTGGLSALRADIAAAQTDPNLGVFAGEALTAKSWYEPNDVTVDGLFNAAINNVLNNAEDPGRALLEAQTAVGQLL